MVCFSTSLIINNKLYYIELCYLSNGKIIIRINILEKNKIKNISIKCYCIESIFTYKNNIYYIVLDQHILKSYVKYKVFSINLESFDISYKYSFIKKQFYFCKKNCFIWNEEITTFGILDIEKWDWSIVEIPIHKINALTVTNDYKVIKSKNTLYCIDKFNSIKEYNIDFKANLLFEISDYKNYVLYKNIITDNIYIYDARLNQLYEICNIKEKKFIFYKFRILYFNYTDIIKNINIKFYDLSISRSLFEKCIYWVDENKFPEIAKNRIIEYRKNNLILI